MRGSLLDIAKQVFEDSQYKELHVDQIAMEAIRLKPNLSSDAQELSQRLSGALSNNTKKKSSLFRRVKNKSGGNKRGYYALKTVRQKTLSATKLKPEAVTNDTKYIGKAGEYAVAAELLFRGYNATILPVDDGIDVVATRENRYFHIQVKTANETEAGYFNFTIKKRAFTTNNISQTFYIFVMRSKKKQNAQTDYAIFPSSEITRLIMNRVIKDAETLSIKISTSGNKFLLNNNENISAQINEFSYIF